MDPKSIPYRYSSLSPRHDSIRLLRLIPNEDETAVIKCQLFDYTLESGKKTHLYEALSYVWGDSNKTVPIFIGDHRFNITENLHTALLHLRNHSIERIIWVDAVCINQADEQEKAHQIQYMGKIYGQASHVIIWLGEAADNSDQAFEDICVAAEDELTNSLIEETNQKAILKVLERLWFRRIWVLQEVAAARSVLIMCGPAEMNGYAFCSGLNKLGLSSPSGLQGLIRSAIYLIRGAIFRSRYAKSVPSRVSLGELIDMYHNREATMRNDKIYALLGMSSEGPTAAGLSPNYQVPWKELLRQLVGFLLYKEISVETWDDREMAVITSKGFILGQVSLVESDSARYDRQHVTINFQNTRKSLEYKRGWGDRWALQASAKPIQNGDIVCLLQGASKPTIIRTRKDHFAVIVIAVTPQQDVQTESIYVERQGSVSSMEGFSRDFLLVWNWDESNEPLAEINTLVPEYSRTASNKIASLYNVALILQDVEEYEEAGKRLQEKIEAHEEQSSEEHPYKLACMENPAFIFKKNKQWEEAEDLFLQVIQTRKREQGMDHPDTLSSIANLASTYVAKEGRLSAKALETMDDLLDRVKHNVQILEEEMVLVAKSFGKEMLRLLLDLKRDNIQITEEVLKAAVGNWAHGYEVIALLFDQRGDDIQITEEVLKAAARNGRSGYEVTALLLDQKGSDSQITEEVLKAAAGNGRCGYEVMALFLDQRGEGIQITEEVLKAAVQNAGCEYEIMLVLLDRRGNDIQITEEVLKAVARNRWCGRAVMALLLNRKGDEIQITEEVLKATAENRECGQDVLALLLDRRGDNIQITKELLKVAS